MGNPMEELRVRLDELDVAWWQRKCHTCWKVEKKQGTEHWRAWLAPDGTITLKVDAIYGFTPEQAIAATVGRCDTMGLWPEWEQVLFANVSDEVAQDNLNECVHELLDKAATIGERNPDGLPIGLTVSNDGNLLNWVGENYVRQDAATVGRGNLTAEQVRECSKGVYFEGYSDGATHRVNGIEETDWQAIADKLNATLGAGTCRNKGFVDDGGWYFVCSKCGCEFEYGDFACEFAEGHGLGSPKFCPNCGAKVVDE